MLYSCFEDLFSGLEPRIQVYNITCYQMGLLNRSQIVCDFFLRFDHLLSPFIIT